MVSPPHVSFTCSETYIYQVRLVAGMKVVDNRCLVEVRELCHVVCSIELRRIDFIHAVCIDFALLMWTSARGSSREAITLPYTAVVALDQQTLISKLFDDPTLDESEVRIPKPDISLSREVILAFNGP